MTRVVAVLPTRAWSVEARILLEQLRGLARHGIGVAVATPSGGAVAQAAAAMTLPSLDFDPGDAGWWRAGALLGELLREARADALLVADEATHLAAARAVRRVEHGVVFRRVPAGVALASSLRTRLAARLAPTWLVHATPADAEGTAPVVGVRGHIVAPLGVDAAVLRAAPPVPVPLGARSLVLVVDRASRRATSSAIRTVAALRRRGHPWRITCVGEPYDDAEVRLHGTAVGLGDALQLVGAPIDRAALVAGADAVWVVADHDDGGLAVLEAMALGRPVLVTRGTLGERYVDHPLTGLVVERDDEMGTAAILATLDDDDVREALGDAAREAHDAQHASTDITAALATAVARAGDARAVA